MKQRFPIWLIAAVALAGVLSVPSLFRPTWNVDEGFSAANANLLLDGGIPYRDAVDHRGPVTTWLYAIVFLIAGKNNMFAIHVVLIALKMILTALVAALGVQTLGSRGRAFATLSFAIMANLGFPNVDLYALHTEWILVLCTCLASLLLFRGLLQPGRFVSAGLLAGVCFGVAFFTKQPSLLDFAAALAFLVVLIIFLPEDFALKSRSSLLLFGALIGSGFLLVGGSIVGYFLYHHAWDDFVFYFFIYNREYYIAAMPEKQFYAGLMKAYTVLIAPFGFGGLAVLGGTVALLQIYGSLGFERTRRQWLMLYVTIWGLGGLIATMLPARVTGHYFIQLMPSWCLLAGAAYEALAVYLMDAFAEGSTSQRRQGRLLMAGIVAAFCAVYGVDPLARGAISAYRAIKDPPIDAAEARLVAFLQQNTTPQDRIFVWGFRPQEYVLSGRDPASRFTYCTFIAGLIPWANTDADAKEEDIEKWAVPGTCDLLVADLRKTRPRFIIQPNFDNNLWGFVRFPLDRFPKIAALLNADYEIEKQFEGDLDGAKSNCRVYRRKSYGTEDASVR